MPGRRDTPYSQFDSRRRINGNARLLEGGNTLNSLFLRLLGGDTDNGPRVWPERGRAAAECGTRADRHRVCGTGRSGRARHNAVPCPPRRGCAIARHSAGTLGRDGGSTASAGGLQWLGICTSDSPWQKFCSRELQFITSSLRGVLLFAKHKPAETACRL